MRYMSSKMNTMENILGHVAGVQECQMERLVGLANQQFEEKKKEAARKGSTTGKADIIERADSVTTDDEDYEWKEYHGVEMWRKERDLKHHNPFDHKAHLQKGEKI